MSCDAVDTPAADDIDIHAEDATSIFIPGAVIGDEDEFGTLVAATVVPRYISHIGVSKATIRILPISERYASVLKDVVTRFSRSVSSPLLLRYIGVWRVSTETWLVSERRHTVSLSCLFDNIYSADIESIISYVARRMLQALNTLHEEHVAPHLYIRPSTVHLSADCSIVLSEVAIYTVLRDSLSSRRSFPGTKVWPVPSSRESDAIYRTDVWDLGVMLIMLVDGSANIARMYRSRRRVPALANPARWSAQFNSFISYLFGQGVSLATPSELLQHRFVAESMDTACRAAIDTFLAREESMADPFNDDLISGLFRQNEAVVRTPFISIDDVSTDHFEYETWKGVDQNRPIVELSLVRMLNICKERPLTVDVEENKANAETIAKFETFLDTADMM